MTSVQFWFSWLQDLITWVLLILGAAFFLGGTSGLLRFPDVLTRLHALTKADNLGLGLICLGLAWQAGFTLAALKLLLIWLLALLASTVSCFLVAGYVLRTETAGMRHEPLE
jgi:multicomponent Na+:H+ antiporter subunit G